MRAAGSVAHELPFAFCEDDVVLRGSLDICVRDADGSAARGRPQDDRARQGASPRPWSRASTRCSGRSTRSPRCAAGAPAAEIAFCFLERPEETVSRRYAADGRRLAGRRGAGGDRPAARVELHGARRARTARPARRSTASARRRAGSGSPHEPPRPRPRRPSAACARSCGACARAYPEARCSLDFTTPWELLVATILSAQCTDERVNMVTPGLFRALSGPAGVRRRRRGRDREGDLPDRLPQPEGALAARSRAGRARAPRRQGAAPHGAARAPAGRGPQDRRRRQRQRLRPARGHRGRHARRPPDAPARAHASRPIRSASSATSWRSCRARPGSSGRTC